MARPAPAQRAAGQASESGSAGVSVPVAVSTALSGESGPPATAVAIGCVAASSAACRSRCHWAHWHSWWSRINWGDWSWRYRSYRTNGDYWGNWPHWDYWGFWTDGDYRGYRT